MAVLGEQLRTGPHPTAIRRAVLERRRHPHAAALHRDMVTIGLHNSLTRPAAPPMLGTPVDLGTATTDMYIVAGVADHISPWQACYRSARLLDIRSLPFMLSTSGQIAALVNPPDHPKSSYRMHCRRS